MEDTGEVSRQTVELSLDKDVLRRAGKLTDDLNGKIEELLTQFISEHPSATQADQEQIDVAVDFFNELNARCGLLSDEFPSF